MPADGAEEESKDAEIQALRQQLKERAGMKRPGKIVSFPFQVRPSNGSGFEGPDPCEGVGSEPCHGGSKILRVVPFPLAVLFEKHSWELIVRWAG